MRPATAVYCSSCSGMGLRVSEACGLQLSQVDIESRVLHVARLKHGLSTTHPLRGDELRLIKAWLGERASMKPETDTFFISERRSPLSRKTAWLAIRTYGERAGLPVDAHPLMLRHACGFALADQGADTRLIQDYLGHWNIPHSIEFSGGVGHCSSKASRREDLEIEQPVACWDCSSFHFHATLASMLGATLIRYQVVEVRQPREKRLLASFGMVEAFHREQFPLDGIMRLIQQGAGCRHLRVGEHRIPACFLLLKPAPDALAVGRSRRGGNMGDKVAEPLTQRKHPQALALACSVEQGVELRA